MQVNRFKRSQVLLVRPAGKATQQLVEGLTAKGFTIVHVRAVTDALAEVTGTLYPLILLDLTSCASAVPATASAFVHESQSTTAIQSPLAGVGPRAAMDALHHIRQITPASQVVILVGPEVDLSTCCEAVTLGAASFIEWSDAAPAEGLIQRIADRLEQAFARYEAAVEEGRELTSCQIFDETGVAGRSQIMAKLLFHAKRAALISDAPVLITGESGTGKQLLAEAVHHMDPKRRGKPFVSVNCAAITGSLAESALFGHRKGAFTGATEDRAGYFRSAQGGTILLDEISELDKTLQPKLLRVLQEGKVMPVGDDRELPIDVRVIAASNRPLPALVETGDFRLDLYQRLNVITLDVPPLRDRPEDIPLLVQFFLRRYADYYPGKIDGVDEAVYAVLARSIGAGNVRELENAIRRILAFKKAGTRIELCDIPPGLLVKESQRRQEANVGEALTSAAAAMIASGRMNLTQVLDEFEAMIIREALNRSQGVTHAELARNLGLSRRTFYNKLRKIDIPPATH